MKVLYIITLGDLGGAQKYVLNLAKQCHGTIAAGGTSNSLFQKAETQQIPTVRLHYMQRSMNPILDILSFFELVKVILNSGCDIVHTNSTKAGVLGSIAGKLCGKKVVFTAHGVFILDSWSPLKRTIGIWVAKIAGWFQDEIIAVAESDRQTMIEMGIASAEKITTIHNGIEPLTYLTGSEARHKLQLSEQGLVIGTVGRLHPQKGIDILIEAIQQLPDSIKQQIQVVVIGDGPKREELQNQINEFNLRDKIKLAGAVEQGSELLKAFSVFVLPSRYEGFPYTLLEASQAGLPIITTRVGGNEELLGTNAIYTKPEATELAGAIEKLLNDPELMQRLSEKVELQAHKFTIENMVAQTQQIYAK